MSVKKHVKLATVSLLLLGLVGCGNNDSKTSTNTQKDAVCTTLNCMSYINWKFQLQGQVFPSKVRVEINGESVLDECRPKQQYSIDRETAPQSFTLYNFYVPKNGIKVHILDRGYSCNESRTFMVKENAEYELVKSGSASELLINL